MSRKKINISVLAENTHNNGIEYYGEERENMVVEPLPENIVFIREIVHFARGGHQQEAPETIIVLPEFILQPLEGAYTYEQRVIVNGHLQAILRETPDNVLVVFGTVVSESTDGKFYNDLVYGIGSGDLQHSGKNFLSDIDLIFDDGIEGSIGWDNENPQILKRNLPPQVWDQSEGEMHTINFRGKRIGFSICLDYAYNELANRLGEGNVPVDLHIVSSCGMKFINDQLGIYKNGSKVIVCDAYGEWSSVRQVNEVGQSKQRSSFLTSSNIIAGKDVKIRRTQISMPV